MVDYEYSGLFGYGAGSVDKDWKIRYAGGQFTDWELLDESIELTESLCSETELRFGCCEAACLKFEVWDTTSPLVGKWLTVSVVAGGHTESPFTVGSYRVVSDKPSADRRHREVVAYDAMYDILNADVAAWYNSILPDKDSTVTMRQFRAEFARHFGLAEAAPAGGLVNDGMTVEQTIQPEQISGRDVITAICEINGCFGHIGRDGKLHYIYLAADGGEPDGTFDGSDYFDCSYEDFVSGRITGILIRQDGEDVGAQVGGSGNLYIVQDNFLAYGKDDAALREIGQNIYRKISGVSYRPFRAEFIGNPCHEVGDSIRVTTTGQVVDSFILQRTFRGIQALQDSYSASGTEKYSGNVNSVASSILQLKGKTNRLTRTVDETVSQISDLEESTETKFRQTARQIELEAKRAINAEVELAGSLTVAIGEIDMRVTYGDVINAINLSPEQIKIDANKLNVEALGIDLSGYVTISSLSDPDSTTVIDGRLIKTGVIMSENYLDSSGIETGEGSLFNLINGYMVFRGVYNYAWLDRPEEEHDAEIEMNAGRMRIRDKTRSETLYYSHEGISTTEDANKASGVVDFRSGIYGENLGGDEYQGITVQTQGSPVALRALSNQVIIQPNVRQAVNNPQDAPEDYTSDMFTFGMERRYRVDENGGIVYGDKIANGDGLMWYGSRLPRLAGGWDQYTCLQFSADGDNPYTATLSGDRKKLAPHYASNMYKPVKEIRLTKDAGGRITAMRITMDAFVSDEVVDVAVTYDADGNITGIGDTVVC